MNTVCQKLSVAAVIAIAKNVPEKQRNFLPHKINN
jgi:hypothetical protein